MIQFNSFDLFLKPASKPKAHAPENNIKKNTQKTNGNNMNPLRTMSKLIKYYKVLCCCITQMNLFPD